LWLSELDAVRLVNNVVVEVTCSLDVAKSLLSVEALLGKRLANTCKLDDHGVDADVTTNGDELISKVELVIGKLDTGISISVKLLWAMPLSDILLLSKRLSDASRLESHDGVEDELVKNTAGPLEVVPTGWLDRVLELKRLFRLE
jgi:hypothetical protein